MKALIMIIRNLGKETFHPILYFVSPLPGSPTHIVRYKSKGHHTIGFKTRDEALKNIEGDLSVKVKEMGYNVIVDTHKDIFWDGEGIPADVQLRSQ